MPQTNQNANLRPPQKQFPTRELLLYWAAQLGLGLLFSFPSLENIQWLKDLLASLDSTFPTFKTAFIHSSAPVASKLFLVIWWLAIIPWGLMFSYKWGGGFKPHPNGLKMSYTSLLGLFLAGLLMVFMLGTLLSFHDYSYYWRVDKPHSLGRGNLVPTLMTGGPFVLSIWTGLTSFLLIASMIIVLYIPRVFFYKIFNEVNR